MQKGQIFRKVKDDENPKSEIGSNNKKRIVRKQRK
jgi:hypothetical protein